MTDQEILEGKAVKRSNRYGTDLVEVNRIYKKLADEGSENYFSYIDFLGLSNEDNVVVLSSSNHYYYDDEDMKDIRIIVNQKSLNYIKELKEFLQTIHFILPQNAFFIGSFIDGKNSTSYLFGSNKHRYQLAEKVDPVENGISSRFPLLNMIYDFMDSRTNRYLTSKTARVMLEAAGFEVQNMREINGLTFFEAISRPSSD